MACRRIGKVECFYNFDHRGGIYHLQFVGHTMENRLMLNSQFELFVPFAQSFVPYVVKYKKQIIPF